MQKSVYTIRPFGYLLLFLFSALFGTSHLSAQNRIVHGPPECESQAAASATAAGFKYSDKGEYEKALAEYLRAVRLEPSCATVHNNLGNGYFQLERYVDAIEAYQQALRYKSSLSWISIYGIGRSYAALDRFDEAINAYNEVIRFLPKEEATYRSRAGLFLRMGKGDSAVVDAQMWLKLKGWRDKNSLYAVLIQYFGLRQTQKNEAASRLLDDAVSKGKKTDWPFPIVRYLHQEINDQELLALATDIGRMTEARTYMGINHSQSGRVDEALMYLNWVKESGKKSYTEYKFAQSELERLEKKRK